MSCRTPAPARAAAGAVTLGGALVLASSLTAAATFPRVVTPRGPIAYADGAPPGFSGGFGEQSCHACHFQAELNATPGAVIISGIPDRFAPGDRYRLDVTLTRADMKMAGFQLTARFADGAQAGSLGAAADDEPRIAVERTGELQYVNQRRAGTTPVQAGTARWTVIWTAPEAQRPVRFHVSANAADGDESASGDYVYTASVETPPR